MDMFSQINNINLPRIDFQINYSISNLNIIEFNYRNNNIIEEQEDE